MKLRYLLLFFLLPITPLVGWTHPSGTTQERQTEDRLKAGFFKPPPQSRPHIFWHWMNGNITREGITADLEAMARVGIGGTQLFNIAGSHGIDIPDGPADYMSDQWLDLLKHAAVESDRLGLELSIHNCAGWATTGGPWIRPEHAMQQLVSSEIVLWGDRRISRKLPQPVVFEGYYRDIAVFAFPVSMDTKYRVHQWQAKAGQRGGRAGRQPDLKPAPDGVGIDIGAIIDVSRFVSDAGVLVWDAPPGRWKILRLGHTPVGTTNHPAPESGRGLEIDKLRREGLDVHWREGLQPILDHLGPLVGKDKTLNNILVDSYEAGLNHWTPRIREEFMERRGYDPTPYLLTLTGRLVGDASVTERFLWDFRRTIADLFAVNYYGYYADLCHDNGLLFSTEPYTSCFEGLMVAAKADIPTGEFWVDGGYSFSLRLAASIAHINGRSIAAAEAFTADAQRGRWQNYPGSIKQVGDWAWTEGINRLVFHSYPHQPWTDKVPGMTMGQYGCHFDRNNTWWEPGRAWIRYIQRSQFLLQSGDFVADVLCFAGDAAPNGGVYRKDIKTAGYDYDACGTDILAALKVEDGELVLPSGRRYRILVLPGTDFLRPGLARKVRDLVDSGATILGPKPKHTPSLAGFPESENEVREIGREVWGRCDGVTVKSNRYGKGQVFWGVSPEEVLRRMNVVPALKIPPDVNELAWINRRTDDADIFFISNQSEKDINTVAGFRSVGKNPEIWNAERGTIERASGWTVTKEHTDIPLHLMPGESVFIVFRHPGQPEADPFVKANHSEDRESFHPSSVAWQANFKVGKELQLRTWYNGSYTLRRASGKTRKVEVTTLPEPIHLEGPWLIRFQPGRGAPAEARFDSLVSWAKHSDPRIRYFSGTAKNSIQFDLPEGFLKDDREVWLDLGTVKVIAEVRLNGENLGVLWNKPFRIELTDALRQGSNELEIDVANLWINRLIGDEQYPDDCDWSEGGFLKKWPEWLIKDQQRPVPSRVTFKTWKHWEQNDELKASGLIGPVFLRSAKVIPLH